MSTDTKWNWKEICSTKQEKVERQASAPLPATGGVMHSSGSTVMATNKRAKTAHRAPGLTPEQKRAASHAKYGVGPSRDSLDTARRRDELTANFHEYSNPEMTVPNNDKFRIYNPGVSSSTTASSTNDRHVAEEFSGLRIKSRLVPAEVMREQMDGRQMIQLAKLETSRRQDLENTQVDWVTIGVMTRANLSKAASGAPFVVWTLSDLETSMASLFLYDDAYNNHWREAEGSIVAVINPAVLPANEAGKFALSIRSGLNVVKLGTSMDFGICKSLTAGGRQCKIPINVTMGDYCVVHVAAKFKAAGKGRQELNGAGTFRTDLFRNGDSVRNVSAGTYAPKPSKHDPAKRKRDARMMLVPTTQVDAVGHVNTFQPTSKSSAGGAAPALAPEFVRKADQSASMEQLRSAIRDTSSQNQSSGVPSKKSLVAKILGVGSGAKKVNMMAMLMKPSVSGHAGASQPFPASKSLQAAAPSIAPLTTLSRTSRPVPGSTSQRVQNRLTQSPSNRRVASLRASGMLLE
ncbi:hypothetical protein H310_05886 [Aphanomyces invadans]|uniref:Uncharacterized protein n=1 Tax=Aphanomyces invadans TaxID=157072 RepID=A0A024U7G3_9STRA|nr:hypothetical protein H310_05886 [Aphanomyces invadans]ETW02351.1 hypothetical protein H310_05886 [Aphanomyces invadans]|eukprot:XP_008868956.1 hypothetical protein H310_05886 [Aphanomyces invadans]